MKILFAAGGTGGHINPAIAIADYMRVQYPDTSVLFIGAQRGLEKDLVPKAGYDIEYIHIIGFKRRITPSFFTQNVRTLSYIRKAINDSRDIIKRFQPDVVIGTGGYVSGPVLYAAAKLGIPTLIHESNAYAGLASKILARYVDSVCLGFDVARRYFKKARRIVVTGNPLRGDMMTLSVEDAREIMRVPANMPFIIASGGSLGAEGFIEAILEVLYSEPSPYAMLFATGTAQYDDVMRRITEEDIKLPPRVQIVPYIYNMPTAMRAADIVLTRGGAMTISELTALGKASIIIPSPNVTMNHQEYNARALRDEGASIMYTERMLESRGGYENFCTDVHELIVNRQKRSTLAANAQRVGITDADKRIHDEILSLLNKQK